MTRFLTLAVALVVLVGAAWGYATLQPCSAPTQKARALGLPVGAASCPGAIASAAAAEAPPRPRRRPPSRSRPPSAAISSTACSSRAR